MGAPGKWADTMCLPSIPIGERLSELANDCWMVVLSDLLIGKVGISAQSGSPTIVVYEGSHFSGPLVAIIRELLNKVGVPFYGHRHIMDTPP